MKFTDRFIRLPTRVMNGREQDITGKDDYECEQFEDYIYINPFEIESFASAIPAHLEFDKQNEICTVIRTKNGDERLIFMTIEEFKKLLNDHQK